MEIKIEPKKGLPLDVAMRHYEKQGFKIQEKNGEYWAFKSEDPEVQARIK
jgi:hypothetical protein